MSPITIERWNPVSAALPQEIEMLGEVLHGCVHSGAGVSFILPFSLDDAQVFWHHQVLPAVSKGTRLVLLARLDERIAGTVQLDLDTPPNQPHRAEVKKLLVHPGARRRGIAKSLMLALEQHAREAGRTLLTLDTVTGDPAEPLYLSIGYIPVGVIPRYALNPDSTEWDSTTIMYKHL